VFGAAERQSAVVAATPAQTIETLTDQQAEALLMAELAGYRAEGRT
jgi:hypothetical protein